MRNIWIILLMVLFCLPVLAEEPQTYRENEWEYTVDEDGTATLIFWWYDEKILPEVVEVPAMLGGYPLTRLGDNAFNTFEMSWEKEFTLVIPEGVEVVENDAFCCCHNAAEIRLPASLTDIAPGCFHHVGAEITVAEGNPRYVNQEGYLIDTHTSTLIYAASCVADSPIPAVRTIERLDNWGWICYDGVDDWPEAGKGLTLVIPEGVESIGRYVIYDSVHISKLVLPDSLKEMDELAFFGTALTEIQFGKGLTSIPAGCFSAGYDLKEVTLPPNITFVGYWAFDEGVRVTALNPDCHFETEEEYILRTGEDPRW